MFTPLLGSSARRSRRTSTLPHTQPLLEHQSDALVRCRDELRAAWAVFTPLLHAIERKEVEVHQYTAGSRGPEQADKMIAEAGYVKNEVRCAAPRPALEQPADQRW